MTVTKALADEQEVLDQAYRGLLTMRVEANRMLASVLDLGRGGTFQSRTERDIVVRTSMARLAHLDVGDQALCFGRIDQGRDGEIETFHIGRLGITGKGREQLVVDWRAPVAAPFYRATGLDPHGLVRRRHLAVKKRIVTSIEDEHFSSDPNFSPAELTQDLGGGVSGAVLSALEMPRTGQMGDIVATIQKEQDEIIRAPLAGLLMVQGGPGTGKTAVALHRAAFLLYTHRFPLERQGVLVVGPNPLFLGYIHHVLPSLGESGVTLSTIGSLVSGIKIWGTDTAKRSCLKGDAKMVEVLAQGLRTRQRGLKVGIAVPFGGTTLTIDPNKSVAIARRERRRRGPHNARSKFIQARLIEDLIFQYARYLRSGIDAGEQKEGDDDDLFDRREVTHALSRHPGVVEAMERMWPRLSPHEFIHDLFGAKPLLAQAGRGILSEDELALLYRPRSKSLEEIQWTEDDAALIDEARELLGARFAKRTAKKVQPTPIGATPADYVDLWSAGLGGPLDQDEIDEDELKTYGHIVVDEIQDLSPMQLRMLARRSIANSFTVVGDVAQAAGANATGSWSEVARHLAPQRRGQLVELSVSYRTPGEMLDVAARILPFAAPEVRAPLASRHVGYGPLFNVVSQDELFSEVVCQSSLMAKEVSPGHVAVLVSDAHLAGVLSALEPLGAVDPRGTRDGLLAPLVVLPAHQSNGLEFDGVVVVEPAMIAAGGEDGFEPTVRGMRALYVALTRMTRMASIVASRELPHALWR